MKNLVILAAALEIPTGMVLIFAPSDFTQLLFGAEMSGAGQALAPLAGFALVALAVACWPVRGVPGPSAAAVRALLAFSFLCAVYLAYQGISAEKLACSYGPRLPVTRCWDSCSSGVGSRRAGMRALRKGGPIINLPCP